MMKAVPSVTNLLKARASGEPSYTFGAIGFSPDLYECLKLDFFDRDRRLCNNFFRSELLDSDSLLDSLESELDGSFPDHRLPVPRR